MSLADVVEGDCLEVLAGMPAASVDAVVTDPPYGLGFMGKAWDALPPGREWAEACRRVLKPGGHLVAFGGTRTYHRLACAVEDAGLEVRDCLAWLYGSGMPKGASVLKPAHEPAVLARAPLDGSLAANVAAHGVGALNIDACSTDAGRWPANVALDDAAAATLDAQAGERGGVAPASGATFTGPSGRSAMAGGFSGMGDREPRFYGDAGGPSRFYYCAKASRAERGAGNDHPTVKPVDLMRWLVRLVTPPGGLVLDTFAGSGTTLVAATLEGFRSIGVERDPHYCDIARRRVAAVAPPAPSLFDAVPA